MLLYLLVSTHHYWTILNKWRKNKHKWTKNKLKANNCSRTQKYFTDDGGLQPQLRKLLKGRWEKQCSTYFNSCALIMLVFPRFIYFTQNNTHFVYWVSIITQFQSLGDDACFICFPYKINLPFNNDVMLLFFLLRKTLLLLKILACFK